MKTLVVGAAMIDMLMKLDQLPKSGEDVLCKETKLIIGGCAYNVASTLRNMECEQDLCVPVGTGSYADIIASELQRCGYRIMIKDESQDNGYCLALVEADGERTFITAQGIEGAFKKEWFTSIDMNQYDNVYLAGYQVCGEGKSALSDWIKTLTEKTIYFAPGPVICVIENEVMDAIFSAHPVLHLNEKEAADYTGQTSIEDCLKKLYERTENLVIITLGEKGTAYYDGTAVHTVPSQKASVTDTIGAGDSHIGAMIGGISKGLSIEDSVQLANKVAAAIVGIEGPTMDKQEFDKKVGEDYE